MVTHTENAKTPITTKEVANRKRSASSHCQLSHQPAHTASSATSRAYSHSYSPVDNVFVPVLCPATSLSNGQDTIVAQCGRNCDSNSRRYSNSGEEICETYPPFSLSVYDVNIAHSNGTCSYVFMVDADYVDMSYVSQSQRSVLQVVRNGTYIPVRLNWVYEYLPGLGFDPKCSQSEEGYSCHCPSDEGANPYLPNGCQKLQSCASCNGDCYVDADDYTQVTCFHSTRSRARLLAVILGLSVGFRSLFLAVGCYWLWRFLRKRKQIKQRAKHFKRNGGLLLQQQMSPNDGVVEKTKLFTARSFYLKLLSLSRSALVISVDRAFPHQLGWRTLAPVKVAFLMGRF